MALNIGTCTVVTTKGEIGGSPVRYHTIRTGADTRFGLHFDIGLSYPGWVRLEPNSLLIDQASTAARMSRPAGFLLKERLMAQQPGCSGFVPINFWQLGTILLHASSEGGPDLFAGSCPDGVYSFIIKTASDGWEAVSLKFRSNKPDTASQRIIDRAEMGFSMPLILQDGHVRSLNEYAGDPRVLGDLRNFVDFGCGVKGLPSSFWLQIRKVLPGSAIALRRMLSGEKHVEVREGSAMLSLEIDEFAAIIEQFGLGEHLRIERVGDEIHFTVQSKLPIQRVPVVGVGFDANHQLIAVVAEGRQPHSAGVSSEQLAQLMKDEGAVTAGLGSAGGDAGVWANIGGEFKTLSSGPYRPAPCLLVMG